MLLAELRKWSSYQLIFFHLFLINLWINERWWLRNIHIILYGLLFHRHICIYWLSLFLFLLFIFNVLLHGLLVLLFFFFVNVSPLPIIFLLIFHPYLIYKIKITNRLKMQVLLKLKLKFIRLHKIPLPLIWRLLVKITQFGTFSKNIFIYEF